MNLYQWNLRQAELRARRAHRREVARRLMWLAGTIAAVAYLYHLGGG